MAFTLTKPLILKLPFGSNQFAADLNKFPRNTRERVDFDTFDFSRRVQI